MDQCPVCCSPYLKPKLLPCLDTVCFSCLDEHVVKHGKGGTFPCPVCQTLLAIPQGGITLFDDNLHIKGKFRRYMFDADCFTFRGDSSIK